MRNLGIGAFQQVERWPGVDRVRRHEWRQCFGGQAFLYLPDGSLGGAVSRMSVIHLPPQALPAAFAQFHRVLAPGGYLYLEFFASLDDSELGWAFDHKVAPAWRLSVERTAALLRGAGLVERARLIEAPPEAGRSFETAVLIYRKPPSPVS
ncbi:class I SAM-dependent methyltransferase [Glycomyces sp. YM15]|uniref:class I SAM-dependent methyltransferase n=1 Tax=Glycomyces sp. YM15 TaxID=2800446 RepID=UPI0019626800|nr:class I SAM-dependent methyltransferase [Glycomyces sp. YM15]